MRSGQNHTEYETDGTGTSALRVTGESSDSILAQCLIWLFLIELKSLSTLYSTITSTTGVIELITPPPKLIETAKDLFENLES